MSFQEFYYNAKAMGNRYDFSNKVVTFYNITHIILAARNGDLKKNILSHIEKMT